MTSIAIASVLAFNLICSGQMVTGNKYAGVKNVPYTTTYRIDLDSRKWCDGKCNKQWDIHDVSNREIIITDKYEVERNGNDQKTLEKFDRITGLHRLEVEAHDRTIGELTIKKSGSCKKADFTGFPSPEQKF